MNKAILIAAITFHAVFVSFVANVDPIDDRLPPRFRPVLELLNTKHCGEAWKELWRLAGERDYFAFYALVEAGIFSIWKIEGTTETESQRLTRAVFFYATLSSEAQKLEPSFFDGLRPALASSMEKSDAPFRNQEVADCLKSSATAETCVNIAVKRGVVPPVLELVAEVQKLNRERLKVECGQSPESVQELQPYRRD